MILVGKVCYAISTAHKFVSTGRDSGISRRPSAPAFYSRLTLGYPQVPPLWTVHRQDLNLLVGVWRFPDWVPLIERISVFTRTPLWTKL